MRPRARSKPLAALTQSLEEPEIARAMTIARLQKRLLDCWSPHGLVDLVVPQVPAKLNDGDDLVDLVAQKVPSLHAGFRPAWWATR